MILRVEYVGEDEVEYLVKNEHTRDCVAKNGYGQHMRDRVVDGSCAKNLHYVFQERCKELAIDNMFKAPQRIWEQVLQEMSMAFKKDKALKMPDNQEVS